MPNSYYNHATYPTPNSPGSSAQMRAELQLITEAFDKLPTLTGAANRIVVVNSAANALTTTTALSGLAITGSTINSSTIGASVPAGGWFTTLSATGAVSLGSSVAIAGGTINGTQIGNTTPSSGAFTSLSASSGITGNLTGNVTGNLTGNVTGNLTGNVTGNVTASSGTSTFNNVTINGTLNMDAGTTGTIENLSTPVNSGDAAPKGYVDAQVATRLALAGGTMSGAIAMGTNRITGLGDPVNAQDATTKIYVDNAVQGLDAKASCRVATTANITLSGTQTIDGVAVVAGNRVLVKNQSAPAENGIYVVASGAWTRAADADTWDELVHAFVFVEQGTDGANNGYVCTVTAGGTLGTTAVTWVQFSGAGQVIAGTGLTKSGNTLNVNTASSARIVVGADDIDLATTGIAAGTYRSLTIDVYGRATAGTNPTTLSGYGITDAYTTTQTDTLLSGKLSLTGGTMSGAIAMGTNKITGLGDPTNAQDAATKNYTDSILGSATSAAASAAAALQSEINAAASESNAAGSASAALTSANNAAASYDAFDDRYLGSKTADPTLDNDGNPLLEGALYWNSVTKIMKVYDGANWAAAYLPAAGYLPVSGGTMTGNITFAGTQAFPGVLPLSGGTMTGAIAFAAGQTISGYLPLTGGTVTGDTSFNGVNVGRGGSSVSTNTTAGNLALSANTSGGNNTALGRQALRKNTSGGSNTAVGGESLVENLTGSSNTAVGYGALYNNTASGNTAVGQQAGVALTSGENNVAIGNVALYNATTSSQNTAVGAYALAGATGEKNVGIGYFSGQAITTGAKNVVLGSFTGLGSFDIRTSNNHVVLSDGDGNVRMVFDNGGAMGLAGANYGTAGQVPVSQGAGLPPVWGDVGGGIDAVATTTSATSITLTSASAGYQSVAMTAMGKHITLPDATTMNLGGPVFIIKNDGGYPFGLRSADGALVMGVAAGGIAYVTLKDKSTAAGSWSVVGDNLEPGLITIDSTFSSTYNANVQFPFAALDNNVSIHFARLASGFAAFVVDNVGGVISTPVTVDATASSVPRACFKISSTSAIVFFGNNGNNSKCAVLSLTGSTPSYSLSVGSIVNIVAGGAFPSGLSTTWSGENSVGAPKIAQLTSSLYLFSATSGTNTAVAAISVSGTTVSVSTSPANIITSASATDSTTTYRLTDTTALVLYKSDTAGGAPYKNNAVVISVSGTTCTIGTSLNTGLTSQYTSPSNSTLLSATKAILADDGNATNTAKAVAVTISGTTVTAGSVLTVETASNIAGSIGQYVGNESNTRWNPHLWPIGSNTAGLWYIDSPAYVSRNVVLSESGGTLTAGTILYRSISQNAPSSAGGGVILPQGTSEYVALVNGFDSTAGAAYNLTTAKISGTAITQGASIAAVDLGSANNLLSFSAAKLAIGKYVLIAGNSNKAGLMCFESNGDFFKNHGSVSIPAAFYGSNVVAIPAVSANRVVLLATDERGTTAGSSTSVLSLLNLEIAA